MLVIVTNIPTPYRTAFFNVLHEELENRNIGFHVVYCAKTEPRRSWKFKPEENTYNYTFLKGISFNLRSYYLHLNFNLTSILKKLQPKWLILAGSWNAFSTVQILLSRNFISSQILLWSEGHLDSKRNSSKLVESLRNLVFKSVDAFVVPNARSKEYIQIYNKKALIGFLPNTVDEIFFSDRNFPSKENIIEKYNIKPDVKIIICVARLDFLKGVFDLMKAYSLLEQDVKDNLTILFVGSGELYNVMNDYKNNNNLKNLILFGQKNEKEVRELLYISDAFILPTRLDSNPLTPIEAGFVGKPLLLSKLAGNHDELVNENTGISINSINEAELKKVLIEFYSLDKEELLRLSQNSFQNVCDNFSRKNVALNLINFLLDLKK